MKLTDSKAGLQDRQTGSLFVSAAYFGAWLSAAALIWLLVRVIFHYDLSAALIMLLFILPMLMLSGYREEIADRLLSRSRDLPDDLWQVQPEDRTAPAGAIRWNMQGKGDEYCPACQSYVRNRNLVLFNASLYDLAGFIAHTDFTRCLTVDFEAQPDTDCIRQLTRHLAQWAAADDAIAFAGIRTTLATGQGTACLYYQPQRQSAVDRQTRRIIRKFGCLNNIRDFADPEWQQYSQLLPDRQAAISLYNHRRSADWHCKGVDISREHLLYYIIEFAPDCSSRPPAKALAGLGFSLVSCQSDSCLILTRSLALTPVALDQASTDLLQMIEQYHGCLAGCELDEKSALAAVPASGQNHFGKV